MTANKPGTVTQQPLYGCTSCYEECTYPADHLRVNDGECWCDLCWDERRWEFPDQPSWNDLEPYTPSLQTECEKLRKNAKLWESNHDEIHRRADKEHALAVPDGFREIVEAVAHIGVDFGYGNFSLSQEHIEKARELLAAAPSHSQQSEYSSESLRVIIEREADRFFEWPSEDRSHVTTVSTKLFAEHIATLYASPSRCLSHESEQGK